MALTFTPMNGAARKHICNHGKYIDTLKTRPKNEKAFFMTELPWGSKTKVVSEGIIVEHMIAKDFNEESNTVLQSTFSQSVLRSTCHPVCLTVNNKNTFQIYAKIAKISNQAIF